MKRMMGSLLTAALLAAQTASPVQSPPENTPTFRISTDLVAVDLVATDHAGRPITDLKASDLRVTEDKVDRAVKDLHREAPDGKASQTVEFSEKVKQLVSSLPKGVATNLTAIEAMPASSATTVLLLDSMNTQWGSRARTRLEMLKLLKTFDPKQPVAVYGLSGSLHLLQGFTSDPAALRATIDKAGSKGVAGGRDEGDLIDHTASDLAAQVMSERMFENLRAYEFETSAAQEDVRVQRTIEALNTIARQLQGFPGRKNLIWVSESFPLRLMPDEFGTKSRQQPHDYDLQLLALASVLEDARVSVYPVDPQGLQMPAMFDADRAASGPQTRYGMTAALPKEMSADSVQNSARYETMNMIAESTGGRAFYNRNDLGHAVAQAIQDGGTYYALTFVPKNTEADGKFHVIRITTSRKGIVLRYRHGYYALDPQQPSPVRAKLSQQEMHAALMEPQLSTGVVLFAKRKPDANSIDLAINLQSMSLEQAESGADRIQFELTVVTFDKKGTVLTTHSNIVNANLDRAKLQELMQQGMRYSADFLSTADTRRVRIGVRDLASNRIGTVDVKLD